MSGAKPEAHGDQPATEEEIESVATGLMADLEPGRTEPPGDRWADVLRPADRAWAADCVSLSGNARARLLPMVCASIWGLGLSRLSEAPEGETSTERRARLRRLDRASADFHNLFPRLPESALLRAAALALQERRAEAAWLYWTVAEDGGGELVPAFDIELIRMLLDARDFEVAAARLAALQRREGTSWELARLQAECRWLEFTHVTDETGVGPSDRLIAAAGAAVAAGEEACRLAPTEADRRALRARLPPAFRSFAHAQEGMAIAVGTTASAGCPVWAFGELTEVEVTDWPDLSLDEPSFAAGWAARRDVLPSLRAALGALVIPCPWTLRAWSLRELRGEGTERSAAVWLYTISSPRSWTEAVATLRVPALTALPEGAWVESLGEGEVLAARG